MSERRRSSRRRPASPAAGHASPAVDPARPLPAFSRLWRIVLMLALIAVLIAGQLLRSNDLFPFGSLDQYSKGTDPNGQVVNTCLQGVRAGSEPFDIPFGNATVGIQRADVENHLRAITNDPSRLVPLAQEYDRRHADEPPLSALILCQRITHLKDGAPDGDPEFKEVTRWEAGG